MQRRMRISWLGLVGLLTLLTLLGSGLGTAQEKSVRPDINKEFKDPDPKSWLKKFETESREVWKQRQDIVAACKVRPGMVVADIGSGTGLFSRLLAQAVGPTGKVYAVDIAQKFVDHVTKTSQDQGLKNVVGVVCTQTSAELPPGSVDMIFICDVYHHFEFPHKTMATIHRALRPGGQIILLDFKRIKGVTPDWIMKHVRAGQEVFTQEIQDSGFVVVEEVKLLKDNYFLRFHKLEQAGVRK